MATFVNLPEKTPKTFPCFFLPFWFLFTRPLGFWNLKKFNKFTSMLWNSNNKQDRMTELYDRCIWLCPCWPHLKIELFHQWSHVYLKLYICEIPKSGLWNTARTTQEHNSSSTVLTVVSTKNRPFLIHFASLDNWRGTTRLFRTVNIYGASGTWAAMRSGVAASSLKFQRANTMSSASVSC